MMSCSSIRVLVMSGVMCVLPCSTLQAQVAWPLWQSYVSHFGDPQGRLIEHSAGERTTSEAQAYGLFFALIANDRDRFDRILGWTESNLTQGGLSKSLPAWLWGVGPQGTYGILDRNSASDADLWMSYTLLQAGRLWKDRRYSDTGAALARLIEQHETADVPGVGWMLLPGSKGFQSGDEYILNPSYVPVQLLQALAIEFPNSTWSKLADAAPDFLAKSASSGFAMDWVAYENRKFNAIQGPGTVAGGSYDAVRVYLWAGMLAEDAPAREVILRSIPSMGEYLRKHGVPPERISPKGYVLQGSGNVGFSAAVLPYLVALAELRPAERQRTRLAASFNSTTGLYGESPTYYDQNLALFATGWSDGRFRFDRNGQLHVVWSKP
jgi:endo-1,4-beta-D-glucanase Y